MFQRWTSEKISYKNKACAIQYIVHFFTFWRTGATNDSIELNVPPHPGTKVMYTWRFGTGDVMHSTDRVANYTWTEAGVYTITLTAENKVSHVQVRVSFIIVVKSNVKNYTWIERGWSSEQISWSMHEWLLKIKDVNCDFLDMTYWQSETEICICWSFFVSSYKITEMYPHAFRNKKMISPEWTIGHQR